METPISYSIVDVFTQTRFAGNPVAVIHDASALDTEQMQAIAQEFGFSETTFILPPEKAGFHARVRIFTPHDEVPFAGHPNIGTAFVMGRQATAGQGVLPDIAVLDELGGPVHVKIVREDEQVVGAEIEAPQALQLLGDVPVDVMAACLRLAGDKIVTRHVEPCVASVGLPFAFVELTDLDALGAVAPDIPSFRTAAETGPVTVDGFAICAFVVVDEAASQFVIRSRVLSPLGHPPEDPATGSASGALGALLTSVSDLSSTSFAITQGVEMGRTSDIAVEVAASGPVRIRGHCVEVSTGTMLV